ncbi:MAG: 2-C-methyl-D-erythritol 4-phosphate cytidylyltransferase [Ruminococcaceae bacterium]|nr:2-C-methyl-D-erythritol 4-phosphate cytidylyltransferase [Oscillospiraceae bacterium]
MGTAAKLADTVRRAAGRNPTPRVSAILVAAGSSTRMGTAVSKQFLEVGGIPVLARTMMTFESSPLIGEIIVVARKEDMIEVGALATKHHITKLAAVIEGGDTRALSVRKGFSRVGARFPFVAIHDGARCLVTPEIIEGVCRAAYRHKAATAACRVSDTVKLANSKGFIESTVNRDKVFLATTPQVFDVNLYRGALETVKDFEHLTDDNQLIESLPFAVKLVECDRTNIKITEPSDIRYAEFILGERERKV